MISRLHRQIVPHNPGRAGRIAAWLVLCALILGAVGFMLGLMLTIGRAHEATDVNGQPTGWNYESFCCQGNAVNGDCAAIPDASVTPIKGGLQITLAPGDHPLVTRRHVFTVPQSDLRKSPDGRTHVCLFPNEDTLRCTYHPPMGF